MKPGKLDLPIIWRGCDWPIITLRWKDLNGNPFNLTGWSPYASTNRFSLNAAVTNAAGGITQLSMTKAQTGVLQLGVQPWSWLWTYGPTNQTIPPVLEGSVIIKEPTSNV
jgi:hypothetical protein